MPHGVPPGLSLAGIVRHPAARQKRPLHFGRSAITFSVDPGHEVPDRHPIPGAAPRCPARLSLVKTEGPNRLNATSAEMHNLVRASTSAMTAAPYAPEHWRAILFFTCTGHDHVYTKIDVCPCKCSRPPWRRPRSLVATSPVPARLVISTSQLAGSHPPLLHPLTSSPS